MSLSENHKLILTVFDKFNSLLRNQFNYYYKDGLLLYISTQHALERYHNDIDLFINKSQLLELKKLVIAKLNTIQLKKAIVCGK